MEKKEEEKKQEQFDLGLKSKDEKVKQNKE